MIFIIMGVSGVGKTTVGKLLSEKIHCEFYDADDFHSKENINKMSEGAPLNDDDRKPWLLSIRNLIEKQNSKVVIACSALKQAYRAVLDVPHKKIVFIYLKGDRETLIKRLDQREGHYAGSDLLDSQLVTLEEPEDALTLNVINSPEEIVEQIIKTFKL